MEFLKLLSETPGLPGREELVRSVILREIQGVFDEVKVDPLGSLICTKKATTGKAPTARVMLAAHMDQIGFYVRYIDDKGFIRIHNVGGFDPRNLTAQKVRIGGKKEIFGVLNPAGKPTHVASEEDRKKQFQIYDFFIDTGLSVKKVNECVRIGDPVTLVRDFCELGNFVSGQAMDNRAAVWVAVRAMQRVKKTPYEIHAVFTVQEEVGLRGAGPATFGLDPEICIALDTTLACDTPGIPPEQSITKAGGGVGIKVMDGASISDRSLVDQFIQLAEKKKIPHQLEILPAGGTDAGAMQRSRAGVRTITLSVPTRYIHTVNEMVHRDDLHAARDLLAAWLGA
jgi:putative aminopeptidase FrvX